MTTKYYFFKSPKLAVSGRDYEALKYYLAAKDDLDDQWVQCELDMETCFKLKTALSKILFEWGDTLVSEVVRTMGSPPQEFLDRFEDLKFALEEVERIEEEIFELQEDMIEPIFEAAKLTTEEIN